MNAKTAAEINALSSNALREYAKEIGVKRAANDTKATLLAKVLNRALEIEKEQAPKATVADVKAKTRRATSKGICNVCNKRRAGNDVGISDMCQPCADEGGWENQHNDDRHGEPGTEFENGTPDCWICHPELNRASDDYVARKGSSKLGMTILAKGTYIHKSEMVKAAIEKLGGDVHVNTSKSGVTRLTANIGDVVVQAQWLGNAWDYAASEGINGKKVRNVKELLRKLGVQAAQI